MRQVAGHRTGASTFVSSIGSPSISIKFGFACDWLAIQRCTRSMLFALRLCFIGLGECSIPPTHQGTSLLALIPCAHPHASEPAFILFSCTHLHLSYTCAPFPRSIPHARRPRSEAVDGSCHHIALCLSITSARLEHCCSLTAARVHAILHVAPDADQFDAGVAGM